MLRRFSAAAALCLLSAAAMAQDFPNRPIKFVVAFPPGGPTDFVARVVADKMKSVIGQPVIIENKPGANGAVGAEMVAKADPDGHTLFFTTVGAIAVTPHMRAPGQSGYDPIKDFAPVTLVVNNTTVLVVKTESPVKDAKELAAQAKAKPGEIPFASTGIGSMPHLALELYQSAAGVKFNHIPYRGAAPAVTDVIGGTVQALFADVPVLLPQIQGGKLKPLAAAADQRNPVLPNVPTLKELGYTGNTDASNWYGVLAPAKTPAPVIKKLHEAIIATLKDPETRKKLTDSGAVPVGNSPDQFAALIKSELDRWGKIIKEKNIKE